MEIVLARYKNRGKVCTFDAENIKCKKGDICIVECQDELWNIKVIVPNMKFKNNSKEFVKILRIATEEDIIKIKNAQIQTGPQYLTRELLFFVFTG